MTQRHRESRAYFKGPIEVVLISPTSKVDKVGAPFAKGLYYLHPDQVVQVAKNVAGAVRKLRVKFSGQDYAIAQNHFSAEVKNVKLDLESLKKHFLVDKLA